MSPTKLIRVVYQEHIAQREEKAKDDKKQKNPQKLVVPPSKYVVVDVDKELDVQLCQICKPKSTSKKKIIAKSDKGHMKIHCVECEALKTIKSNKLFEAHWKNAKPNSYSLRLTLSILDRP